MHFSIAAIAAFAVCAHAFKDTSPFLLFSSSSLPSSLQKPQQLQSASDVLASAKAILGRCSEDIYLFVNQPGTSSSDLSANAPYLKRVLTNSNAEGRYIVSEVLGLNDTYSAKLAQYLKEQCKATSATDSGIQAGLAERKDRAPIFLQWNYPSISKVQSERAGDVADKDAHVYNTLLKNIPEGSKYTVVYTTTPSPLIVHEEAVYESDFQDPVHMDLKRNVLPRESSSPTPRDSTPLFEKYQYFTPGLFMGIVVTLILLSILGVGITAISSLEVSYGAFEKEMGPAAQKKQ